MGRGIDGISAELVAQAEFLKAREPAYERVLRWLDEAVRGELGARLAAAWQGREFNAWYDRPLLLVAALRYDALRDAPSHPLHAALAQSPPRPEAATAEALLAATAPSRVRFFRALRERAVQTNESTRAVAWLWPARLLSAAGETRPLALVDLGSSAGLNLIADELPALWSDELGRPLQIAPRPEVALRLGYDLAPLDVRDPEEATWLRACVWPSDAERLQRLEQGIARFQACSERPDGPRLHACALPDVPAQLERLPRDMLAICLQTIVRDYLKPDDRERYEQGMREFLRCRPPCTTLWAELEVAPDPQRPLDRPALLTLRFQDRRRALRELQLARCEPHPRQLLTRPEAIREFSSAFADRA